MKSDNEIIDKADAWKEKEFKLKAEAIHLRDRRLRAFGRFLKFSIILLASCIALGGAGWGIKIGCASRAENKKLEAIEKLEEDKRTAQRIEAYERAWVQCVEKLSLEECDLIRGVSYYRGFERGFENSPGQD